MHKLQIEDYEIKEVNDYKYIEISYFITDQPNVDTIELDLDKLEECFRAELKENKVSFEWFVYNILGTAHVKIFLNEYFTKVFYSLNEPSININELLNN